MSELTVRLFKKINFSTLSPNSFVNEVYEWPLTESRLEEMLLDSLDVVRLSSEASEVKRLWLVNF